MEDGQKPYRLKRSRRTSGCVERGVRIERTLAGGLTPAGLHHPEIPQVFGDREALTTALDNLVDNAVSTRPTETSVWLRPEDRGATVAIHVRDPDTASQRAIGRTFSSALPRRRRDDSHRERDRNRTQF